MPLQSAFGKLENLGYYDNSYITSMKTYSIEKPITENSLLNNFLKYTTLFIVYFFAAWMAIVFLSAKRGSTHSAPIFNFISNNAGLISVIIVAGIFYNFFKSIYGIGELFELKFDDKNEVLTLKTVNRTTGDTIQKSINYHSLNVKFAVAEDHLRGHQRIIKIYDMKKLIFHLNIEATAWNRHKNIVEIIDTLDKWRKKDK